jgi:hypothetical protein
MTDSRKFPVGEIHVAAQHPVNFMDEITLWRIRIRGRGSLT